MSNPTPDINADLADVPDDRIDLGTAASIIGVTPQTLRRMEERGKISATRTASGHRRFSTHDAIRLARSAPEEVFRSSRASRLTAEEIAQSITADEAARMLGVSRPTLRRWERESKIVAYPARQGKKTLYNRESIKALYEIGG